ncbi:MAG: hypothetical protein J7L14_01250 [Candidatus Diapherotrites archaeon]|nr:hypothetical protein [Candidatus Diapherotrites archaeon]
MADLIENLKIVLSLIYLIWLYSWAKSKLGSTLISVIFAIIVVYLTFFQFPELVWVPVIIFLFVTFGKELFEKAAQYG